MLSIESSPSKGDQIHSPSRNKASKPPLNIDKNRLLSSPSLLSSSSSGISSSSIIPINIMKRIMKQTITKNKENPNIAVDAIITIIKSVELFINKLMKDIYINNNSQQKQSSINHILFNNNNILQYDDIANIIKSYEKYRFLHDIIPLSMSYQDAIQLEFPLLGLIAYDDDDEKQEEEEQQQQMTSSSSSMKTEIIIDESQTS